MSTNSPRNQTIAIALSLLACVLWSGNFFIARGVHEWIPPVTLAFWRWVVAFAVICPLGLPHVLRQWPLIRQHLPFLIGMGVLSVGLYNTLIYIAGHYTNAHNIALIACTAPIWTLFLAGLFGVERLSRFKLGGAICAFIGALVVIRFLRSIVDRLSARFAHRRLTFQKIESFARFIIYIAAGGVAIALSFRINQTVLTLLGGTLAFISAPRLFPSDAGDRE